MTNICTSFGTTKNVTENLNFISHMHNLSHLNNLSGRLTKNLDPKIYNKIFFTSLGATKSLQ